jgi:hypothetical protein
MLLMIFFFLPETLYIYDAQSSNQKPSRLTLSTYVRALGVFRTFPGKSLHLRQFFLPSLRMAKYPSVLFPAICTSHMPRSSFVFHSHSFVDCGLAYGFGTFLPAVTVSHVFSQRYNFSTLVIGLAYGGALTVGGLIGELGGGMVIDYITKRERQKQGENVEPEVRLKAIWTGEILVPVSLSGQRQGFHPLAHFIHRVY